MKRTVSKRLPTLIGLFAAAVISTGNAAAEDLKDLIPSLDAGIVISNGNNGFHGIWQFGGASLPSLGPTNFQIINQRIVPLSSSVTGYTYEYNEDLDIYERSTKTFGPLFAERAQTIGEGRFLVGASYSYLNFDTFEGDDLDSISSSKFQDRSLSGGPSTGVNIPGNIDAILDLDIKEEVTTFYYTYGVTDTIDLGIVVPVVKIDMDASIINVDSSGALPPCPPIPSPFGGNCVLAGSNNNSRASDDYTGIGDVVLRGKWNFLRGETTNVAALLSTTIPTGSTDNLTGLPHMTFTPGFVASRDWATDIGGVGFQVAGGYNYLPGMDGLNSWEYGAGFAIQPLSRASFSVDLLGSETVRNEEFGNSILDLSIGTKIALRPNLLIDFNVIRPLNDQGLRPKAILSTQLEWIYGD